MLNRLLQAVALVTLLYSPAALAETLPLPPNLVGSASDAGEALLLGSEAHEAYFPLASNFLTQKNQAFCGVASIVMVLNAMQLPSPAVPEFDPYTTFTQENVLDARSEAILPVEVIKKQGMTLDQLGGILSVYPVKAEVHHAADTTVDEFRAQAQKYLATAGQFVIVNYLRKAIGQEKGRAYLSTSCLRC